MRTVLLVLVLCPLALAGPAIPADDLLCSIDVGMLWPPNHSLVNPGLHVILPDAAVLTSVEVYSDEDDLEETGSGHHSPDARNLAPECLRLRAERKGNADGRVYLIIVRATDVEDVEHICCLTVIVPHNMSDAAIAGALAQAQAAEDYCELTGQAPPGYVVVGEGPEVGPKQ